MAYALFNSGAAQAYANSFRQRTPYGGFENIKSDVGKETLGKIPFLNFKAEVEMAKAGLKEYGATTRQKYHDDATVERAEIMYGDKGSTSKKAALARLMSGSGAVAKRTGGLTSASMLAGVGRRDPMAEALNFTRTNTALDADDAARRGPFDAMLSEAIKGIPQAKAPASGQITVQAGPTPEVKPSAVTSVKSEQTRQDVLSQVLEANGVKLPPTPETPGASK